jgi:hypothetical protein
VSPSTVKYKSPPPPTPATGTTQRRHQSQQSDVTHRAIYRAPLWASARTMADDSVQGRLVALGSVLRAGTVAESVTRQPRSWSGDCRCYSAGEPR